MAVDRKARFSEKPTTGRRTAYEVDGDRILYCDGFRRLAGITQVIWPQDQQIVHTRLTHTLEVNQLARRIAQNLQSDNPKYMDEIDPEVAAAAAYAHDIGHPPFAHIGEQTLNKLIKKKTRKREGFESNAQSFRLVTKLTRMRNDVLGLDLTRATLNAILKYPWLEGSSKAKEEKKFGAYKSDREHFNWARKEVAFPQKPVLDAQIMNMADDIAYSVHDVLDFVRVGMLPIQFLYHSGAVLDEFLEVWGKQDKEKTWPRDENGNPINPADLKKGTKKDEPTVFHHFLFEILTNERVLTKGQPTAYYMAIASGLIGKFVNAVYIEEGPDGHRIVKLQGVKQDERMVVGGQYGSVENQIRFFKQIAWHYLFHHARLKTVQEGQAQVITTLFDMYWEALREWKMNKKKGAPALIPARAQAYIEKVIDGGESLGRLTADILCSLTDHEAYQLYWRMTGTRIPTIGEIAIF